MRPATEAFRGLRAHSPQPLPLAPGSGGASRGQCQQSMAKRAERRAGAHGGAAGCCGAAWGRAAGRSRPRRWRRRTPRGVVLDGLLHRVELEGDLVAAPHIVVRALLARQPKHHGRRRALARRRGHRGRGAASWPAASVGRGIGRPRQLLHLLSSHPLSVAGPSDRSFVRIPLRPVLSTGLVALPGAARLPVVPADEVAEIELRARLFAPGRPPSAVLRWRLRSGCVLNSQQLAHRDAARAPLTRLLALQAYQN